ncbi:myrcene synthase, chloroplastic-like, partial [Juglans microcarpa x Juglans regia]|uniref:myrcene synthase, chloroplastic-like n=1 Tax=Juglans microcarpa x Juglans regia TaxID=2249226 RepID=UPI001B7F786F
LAELKGEVTMMFNKVLEPPKQLDLVDILQRLGVSYHFQDIRRILKKIGNTSTHDGDVCKKESLYTTSLEFRLLRQNGYNVPQEIFSNLKNGKGNFKVCLCDDIEGILALYEASLLLIEGESIMEEARNFATKHLKEYVNQSNDQNLCARVNHALELPLHWRMPRLEARWFIDVYRSGKMNSILLELAELDSNMVQTVHQDILKEGSRWWRHTGLGDLSFARDRLMENFLWTVGVSFQPGLGYNRRVLTKVNALITTIDDHVYDVYGTLDELEIFTDAVERWDVNATEKLPYYMQTCFLSLHNTINEMAFETLKEKLKDSTTFDTLKKALRP